MHIYDSDTGLWTLGLDLVNSSFRLSAAVANDVAFFFFGGQGFYPTLYNATSDAWSVIPPVSDTYSVVTGVADFVVLTGSFLTKPLSFNVRTNVSIAYSQPLRHEHSSIAVIDGRAVFAGGNLGILKSISDLADVFDTTVQATPAPLPTLSAPPLSAMSTSTLGSGSQPQTVGTGSQPPTIEPRPTFTVSPRPVRKSLFHLISHSL